jgi:toxin CptA
LFVVGMVLLGAAAVAWFGHRIYATSSQLNWQFALLAGVWLISAVAVWFFIRQLPQGELDFDGGNWYFADQVGTVSVRFDGQSGMLLRFESEFNRVHWLWLEERFSSNHWHDLRRAVYSRPASQNSLHLI